MGMKLKEFSDAVLDVCKSYYTDIDTLTADRDRLAAENDELREECDAAVEFAHSAEQELAAATATLERLREVVQSDEWIYAKHTDDGQMERIEDILYPQPQPPEHTP